MSTDVVAGAGEAGERLDVVVARLPGVGSRAAAQRLIEDGRVTVDGQRRPKRHVLAAGERVSLRPARPAVQDAAAAVPFAVVHEDEHLLVVDKPAGVVVHPAPGHETGTLAQALAGRAAGGDAERPGIVHRLDRDTSGLMVVAKSERVHRALQSLIRARAVTREYLALVDGRPQSETGTIDAPIGRDRVRRTLISTRSDRPREATTSFWTLETLPRSTLLGVRLETGRTHQIRVHLSEIGHPVCGDRVYGGGPCGQRLGLERPFLHSRKLMFEHPGTGEKLTCESKPPVELRRALDSARREPVSGGPDGG